MKKSLLISLSLAAVAFTGFAQDETPTLPSVNWATVINGSAATTPEALAATEDGAYLVSKFTSKGTDETATWVNFGAAEKVAFGATNKATSGNDNLLVTKVNAQGEGVWHVYSKNGRVSNASVAVTSDGGVVVAASMSFTAFNSKDATDVPANSILDLVDADNNTTTIEKTFASKSVYDIVVLKISAAGHLDWAKQIVAEDGSSLNAKVAVDDNNNIYIGGQHGVALTIGDAVVPARSSKSLYLVKLDNAGNFVKNFDITGTDAEDYIDAVTFADGKLYVAGRLKGVGSGVVNFGDKAIEPTIYDDVFAAAFDTDLNVSWVSFAFATAASDSKHTSQVKSIDYSDGRVHVTGLFKGGFSKTQLGTDFVSTSGTTLEGYMLKFNGETGEISGVTSETEGISGYYTAISKGEMTYVAGYSIADTEFQGPIFNINFNANDTSADEGKESDDVNLNVATTINAKSAGYPTVFCAKFHGNNLYYAVRAKGEGLKIFNNEYAYTNQTDFTAALFSLDLSEIYGGVKKVVADSNVKAYGVEGAVRVSAAEPTTVAVYNVTGQKVAQQAVNGEATIALPAGFYVVNGTKVIVK